MINIAPDTSLYNQVEKKERTHYKVVNQQPTCFRNQHDYYYYGYYGDQWNWHHNPYPSDVDNRYIRDYDHQYNDIAFLPCIEDNRLEAKPDLLSDDIVAVGFDNQFGWAPVAEVMEDGWQESGG